MPSATAGASVGLRAATAVGTDMPSRRHLTSGYRRAVDPRTFLPASRVPVANPPEPGDVAPDLAGRAWTGPTIVSFLRHVGGPFAEAAFVELHERADQWRGIQFVAVSHAPQQPTSAWCAAVAGGPGRVEMLIDEGRTLYGNWGLGPGSLGHFLGRRSLAGVTRLSRQGIRNRHPVGTRWQMAGTFAVDGDGVIRFVHVPAHAGDLPDLEGARRAFAPVQST